MRKYLKALALRQLPDGGFPEFQGGSYRPDSTAWAATCFGHFKLYPKVRNAACKTLVSAQLKDGRIPISPEHPAAFWPTPLAIMAWTHSDEFNEPRDMAIEFLLGTTGDHWPRDADSPMGHDTAIRGWPWISGTHSWVEPTALTSSVLLEAGYSNHPRVHEAVDLLLNRQLPDGGWNYGNTTVFSQELHPMPTPTGAALKALSTTVEISEINASINYLKSIIPTLKSAKSLGWAFLGLSNWNQAIPNAAQLIANCLTRQDKMSRLATTDLAVLLMGSQAYSQQRET